MFLLKTLYWLSILLRIKDIDLQDLDFYHLFGWPHLSILYDSRSLPSILAFLLIINFPGRYQFQDFNTCCYFCPEPPSLEYPYVSLPWDHTFLLLKYIFRSIFWTSYLKVCSCLCTCVHTCTQKTPLTMAFHIPLISFIFTAHITSSIYFTLSLL